MQEAQGASEAGRLGEESLLVIIPAWNEECVVGTVLQELQSVLPDADVVVVSDGSSDGTADVARGLGVPVIELPMNLGVGAAMRTGYLFAARSGYRWAVQLDADGQHDPADIYELLEVARREAADVVIGARFAGKGDYEVKGPRKWAMRVLSVILSREAGTELTDTTSGFKLNSRRAIELFSVDYPAEYLGDTIGALTIATRRGLKVTQCPVVMRPRAGGEPSHGALKSMRFLFRAWFSLAIAMTQRAQPDRRDHRP